MSGAPVDRFAKCWPADLVVLRSILGGGNLFSHQQGSIAHSFHYVPSHHPDMTEILLKRT